MSQPNSPLHDTHAGFGGFAANGRIPVGISSCLLGETVRFDGGHRRNALCTGDLSAWFDWVPVCPEMAIGLGAPREAIRLARAADGAVRLVGSRSGRDHTDAMTSWADARIAGLDGLCGYVVSKRSPTCSLERIRVYAADGVPEAGAGQPGLYMQRFMAAHPLVPVEEDGRLTEPLLRENFLVRVFVLARWRRTCEEGLTAARLVRFHAAHKYLLMAHSVVAYGRLGRLLSNLATQDLAPVGDEYIRGLMSALARPVTRRGHANVLQHLAGYFRGRLPPAHRQRLVAMIDEYRRGIVPLAAPLALVQHFLADFPDDYLVQQWYFAPCPAPLRAHAGS